MEVRRTLNGIKKVHGAKPRRVLPAVRDELMAMIKHTPPGRAGGRNRALLLVGFAGALWRSELAKLCVEDVSFDVRGMILRLGQTKTDQAGENDEIAIPYAKGKYCPVKALKAWLSESGINEDAIFRPILKHGAIGKKGLSGFSVAQIIKASAQHGGHGQNGAGCNDDQGNCRFPAAPRCRLGKHRSPLIALTRVMKRHRIDPGSSQADGRET